MTTHPSPTLYLIPRQRLTDVPWERFPGTDGVEHRVLYRDATSVAGLLRLHPGAGELTHLHLHYARTIALEELADIAALSVSGLHRLFRRHTGTTVSDYLIRMRIGDACARLSATVQPVGHIADAVGYGSLANFNRQFRTQTGMTPREYRNVFRPA